MLGSVVRKKFLAWEVVPRLIRRGSKMRLGRIRKVAHGLLFEISLTGWSGEMIFPGGNMSRQHCVSLYWCVLARICWATEADGHHQQLLTHGDVILIVKHG